MCRVAGTRVWGRGDLKWYMRREEHPVCAARDFGFLLSEVGTPGET